MEDMPDVKQFCAIVHKSIDQFVHFGNISYDEDKLQAEGEIKSVTEKHNNFFSPQHSANPYPSATQIHITPQTQLIHKPLNNHQQNSFTRRLHNHSSNTITFHRNPHDRSDKSSVMNLIND
jgi:hypothetical protein